MMKETSLPESLYSLVQSYFVTDSFSVLPVVRSGSPRQYYRIQANDKSIIGAHSENIVENKAFFSFQHHFQAKGLRVPEIFAIHQDKKSWLLEDLGDASLYDLIPEEGVKPENESLILKYEQVLKDLADFQTEGHKGLDYSAAYPRVSFDERAVSWDLNYFKYYFLKLFTEDFDEDILQDGFDKLMLEAMKPSGDFFMYRDFQSRNIMIKDDVPYYIDFQGGRKGPLAYDVVSLLYQSRAAIDEKVRKRLMDFYFDVISTKVNVVKADFSREVKLFAFIRILQVLGAYGFRGKIQDRPLFLKSIPKSIEYLRSLLPEIEQEYELFAFSSILKKMIQSFDQQQSSPRSPNLTVKVMSFSFLKGGLPADPSGNGGGHVFDCRALPNPGRYEKYKQLTGLDAEVKSFLGAREEVDVFVSNAFKIVSQSIDNYVERGFEHLMISFGCTGGQHRSVYCAERVAWEIKQNYSVNVQIVHYQKELGY